MAAVYDGTGNPCRHQRDAPSAVGAGAVIAIKQGDNACTPDVKYVGPVGIGIAAHPAAILDERQNAAQSDAWLFNSSESKTAESDDALRIRFAAETATLTSIALASDQGLEKALRHIAVMIVQSPDAMTVKPNLSFVDATLSEGNFAANAEVSSVGGIGIKANNTDVSTGKQAKTIEQAGQAVMPGAQKMVGDQPVDGNGSAGETNASAKVQIPGQLEGPHLAGATLAGVEAQ
ncbi:hypothetical protein [Pseudorhizobium tarimense]|uniref:hypothetical protein n=1 Tax=Pseudorhizobium tarimense TaxID=1079109 RepID=UPI0035E3EBDD